MPEMSRWVQEAHVGKVDMAESHESLTSRTFLSLSGASAVVTRAREEARDLASQAERRGFDSPLPLHSETIWNGRKPLQIKGLLRLWPVLDPSRDILKERDTWRPFTRLLTQLLGLCGVGEGSLMSCVGTPRQVAAAMVNPGQWGS